MKRLSRSGLCAAALTVFMAGSAAAAPITTLGAGAAVTNVDRQAVFGTLTDFAPLLNYTEGGLIISTPDDHCCFPAGYYGNGGNGDFTTIKTVDDLLMFGLEFDFFTGFGDGSMNIVWQTLRDGVVTGSGVVANAFAPNVTSNTAADVRGWADVNGFDELRVAAGPGIGAFGDFQALGLDNLKVDLHGHADVPAPVALTLLPLGLLALRRRVHAA